LIAGNASNDDVGPRRVAAARSRHDVVVGGLVPRDPRVAVLALAAVAGVHVLARELDRLARAAQRAQQAHDRRHLEDERDRADLSVLVLLDDLDLAEEEQRDRALPGDTSDRLVSRVQDQRVHGLVPPFFEWSRPWESNPPPPFVGPGSRPSELVSP